MAWLAGAGAWDATAGGARFDPIGMPGAFELGVRDGCVRVRLEPLPGRAAVDVSVQPSVLDHAVGRSAEAAGVDPAVASRLVRRHVVELLGAHGLPVPCDGPLVAVVGAASFPLLREPYRQGRHPVADVPRWVAEALRRPDARSGARALFGDRTTRRVVAAFARRLVGWEADTVDLFRVGLASAAAQVLDADRLARLLEADGLVVAPAHWPRVDDLRAARRVLRGLEPDRVARWLDGVVAADRPDAAFAELVVLLRGVRHHLPSRLPGRLDDLLALCRSLTPLDPRGAIVGGAEPLPPRATTRRTVAVGAEGDEAMRAVRPAPRRRRDRPVPVAAAPTRPAAQARAQAQVQATTRDRPTPAAARDVRDLAFAAPAVGARAAALAASSPDRPLPRPPWATLVDGATLPGDLQLELPRTPAELRAWGRVLESCVGDFGPAALAGRSLLVGVRRHGRLVACGELTPAGTIRQLLGVRNRRVPEPVAAAVVSHLVRAGAVDGRAPQNRAWLHGQPSA